MLKFIYITKIYINYYIDQWLLCVCVYVKKNINLVNIEKYRYTVV